MKLQAEKENVLKAIDSHGENIKTYAGQLKETGKYKIFETRLAHDVLRYIMGVEWLCQCYKKYNCNDSHLTTLGVSCLRERGIL